MRDLEGDLLVDPRVARQIHRTEPAAAEGVDDLVLAERLTGDQHLGGWSIARFSGRSGVRGGDLDEPAHENRFYNLAMLPRFFAPSLDGRAASVELPPDESRHLRQVVRLGVGDEVRVFDGCGLEFLGRVDQLGREAVTVALVERSTAAPESTVAVTLASVMLKGRTFDAVVRDATALGVVAVQPLVAEKQAAPRASSRPGTRRSGAADRWRRIAVAAAKQCGRAIVPEVREPLSVGEFADAAQSDLNLVLAEPGGTPADTVRVRDLLDRPRPTAVSLAVGPEGGWTPDELTRFDARGFQAVTLGGRVLRAETAPVVALAALACLWDEA
ncbi:MAG: 16S rRNA (uracil(1498)-N(3))-methyltransferase [Acidobacteria bacterium]|nr:16S rRNA (uracil(1498)-N(3))-methyltransferase [Acidobacteriota bacterium]